MNDWIEVARIDDFPIGACRVVHANGVRIAVFRLESGFYAIEDVCSHDGGELASGTLNGREITCPRHGARFDITTGEVTAPPAYEAVAVLPVRITA
ncbi:MAG: non-heme iron oxygenase ferredoxin subunit, partial [Chromatiaceae bacterium]|nr:non-heme iron oxygenase ferredoxin subunit [Chromatiaceae bacterium]